MQNKIDFHLSRVLNLVLVQVTTVRSVPRVAIRLGMYQPAVSSALKRRRALTGNPILVRSGAGRVSTDAGLHAVKPFAALFRASSRLFSEVFDAYQQRVAG